MREEKKKYIHMHTESKITHGAENICNVYMLQVDSNIGQWDEVPLDWCKLASHNRIDIFHMHG